MLQIHTSDNLNQMGRGLSGGFTFQPLCCSCAANVCVGSYFKAHRAVHSATLSLNKEQRPRLLIQDGLSFVDYRSSPNADDGKF